MKRLRMHSIVLAGAMAMSAAAARADTLTIPVVIEAVAPVPDSPYYQLYVNEQFFAAGGFTEDVTPASVAGGVFTALLGTPGTNYLLQGGTGTPQTLVGSVWLTSSIDPQFVGSLWTATDPVATAEPATLALLLFGVALIWRRKTPLRGEGEQK